MHVEVLLDGELLTRWTFFSRYETTVCKVIMPAHLMAGRKTCRLEFHVENPQSAERAAKAEGQRVIGEDPREMASRSSALHSLQRTGCDTPSDNA